MKRRFLLFGIILLVFIIGVVTYTKITSYENETGNTKVSVAEVTHSAFYAPLYVAIENGYFSEGGLDVELVLTPGADKVSAAVLSNDVQIGFAGAESAIYVYTGGEKDYLQLFSGLTKRDGQFIVAREENENFTLDDLKGKEILVGRKGGMPALNFLNALKKAGIDEKDININYSVDFAALGGTFMGNVGDYVNLFEPTATALENEGSGYIVASIGELSGEMPYTAFYARKSYINENEEVIEGFTNAIKKGIDFTLDNDAKTIANVILPQFPSLSLNDLEKIVDNYKKADSWLENPYISEDYLENLEDIMIDNDLLTSYVPYKNLVNNFYNE
ncbi:MAG: ABC transporter substrate-binding protein [Bacilli bacterium]|nr:ABC transporter substrate-binding protein [Bacilli bacterium]